MNKVKFLEYTLSTAEIQVILDSLLEMKFKLYFEEIELKGEGKSTYANEIKQRKCQSMIDYFESKV